MNVALATLLCPFPSQAAALVRNSAAAAAFDIHASSAAAAGSTRRPAFAIVHSRAALHQLIAHTGGALTAARSSSHSIPATAGGGVLFTEAYGNGAPLLQPWSAALPPLFADVTGSLDAHVTQMCAVQAALTGGPPAVLPQAAGMLAIVACSAVVDERAIVQGRPLAPTAVLPTHVVWVQVAPGPA